MKKSPNILYVCAGRSTYPSNAIAIRTLCDYFSTTVLVSQRNSFFSRTIDVLFRLPFNVRGKDIIYVGWMGQHLIPFIRLCTRRPIIIDTAPSLYDTICFDRKLAKKKSFICSIIYKIDSYAYHSAERIIVGEQGNKDYLLNVFTLPEKKITVFPICADNSVFYPREQKKRDAYKNTCIVQFCSEFSDAHGVEYILQAAKNLEGSNIHFFIAGSGQRSMEVITLYNKLKLTNVTFVPKRILLNSLLESKAEADICLGMFGDTEKARRSLSNKLFESLAMERAFLTAGPPEAYGVGMYFKDCEGVFFTRMANVKSLAEKIAWICAHPAERIRTAKRGRALYKRMCSDEKINQRIVNMIKEVYHTSA